MGKFDKTKVKEKGTKFNLVHRSLLDGAHADEAVPSDFVVVPGKLNRNDMKRQQRDDVNESNGTQGSRGVFDSLLERQRKRQLVNKGGGGSDKSSSVPSTNANHITELGLPNDGYDYTQHLKPMGEGKFIGADGKERSLAYTQSDKFLELPKEALPSTQDLERGLDTITLDDRVMDEDLRKALFEDADEEGEFEVLDDDFIAQVMAEPDTEEEEEEEEEEYGKQQQQGTPMSKDFDWDAHIAMLIARSENLTGRSTTSVQPRGWDQQSTRLTVGNLEKLNEKMRNEEDDGEEESGSEYSLGSDGGGSDDEYSEGKAAKVRGYDHYDTGSQGTALTGMSTASRTGYKGMSAGAREREEQRFLDTLAEYGDDEIGYLDCADEEEVGGFIDLNELNDALEDDDDEDYEDYEDGEGEEEEGDEFPADGAVPNKRVAHEYEDGASDFGSVYSESQQVTLKAFNQALDEFLRESKDTYLSVTAEERQEVLGEGPVKGSRSIDPELYARLTENKNTGTAPEELLASLGISLNESSTPQELRRAMQAITVLQDVEEKYQQESAASGNVPTMAEISALQSTQFEKERHDYLQTCQEYLQEEREEAQWDCETVLSTYSTLDNHPSLISGTRAAMLNAKKKSSSSKSRRGGGGGRGGDGSSTITGTESRYRSRFERRRDQDDAERELVGSVTGGKEGLTRLAYEENMNIRRNQGGAIAPARITLGGKLNLPEGFGGLNKKRGGKGGDDDDDAYSTASGMASLASKMSRGSNRSHTASVSSLIRLPSAHTHTHGSRSKQSRHERDLVPASTIEEGQDGDEDDEDNDEEDGDDDEDRTQWTTTVKKVAETKDEKRARKAATKEAQRLARVNKKSVKSVYAEESTRAARRTGKKVTGTTQDGVSVFKY